jgi:type II secretory ATPase GspE/PulE/Tfp pilus assembly ATPase PilB-like protein
VRKLCPDCRQEYVPDSARLAQIGKSFKLTTTDAMNHLHKLEAEALAAGIGNGKSKADAATADLATTEKIISKLWKANDQGCDNCNHSGYKGRMGIYEVLNNSNHIQQLIIATSPSDALEEKAVAEGMVTMQTDGLVKALRGQTTIEEILRVTAES